MNMIAFSKIFNSVRGNTMIDNSINASLKAILSCNTGELFGDPGYGSNIKSILFELDTTSNQYLIKKAISEKINKYESRVSTNENLIKIYRDKNSSKYKLIIGYYLKLSDMLQQLELIIDDV